MQPLTKTQVVAKGSQQKEQPRKLSRTGLWMKNNPNGIFVIADRVAVNK